jgi:hypothetical protein
MTAALIVVFIILFVALVIWLILLPGKIVRQKTSATLGWTIATVVTGIIPGLIAAWLYRYKDVSPGKAFTVAVVGFLGFAWLVVGILWSLGFDL